MKTMDTRPFVEVRGLSEGVPSRGIRSLGVMGEGPGNLRFVASSSQRRRRPPPSKKNDMGALGHNCQKLPKSYIFFEKRNPLFSDT